MGSQGAWTSGRGAGLVLRILAAQSLFLWARPSPKGCLPPRAESFPRGVTGVCGPSPGHGSPAGQDSGLERSE